MGEAADTAHFEYIVVGSGAGGGTLAARLAEAGASVLVLEAGCDPKQAQGGNPLFPKARRLPQDYEVPAFHALSTENHALRWDFWVRHYADQARQERDPKYRKAFDGKPVDGVFYPRAGTLGGCTAHNAMILLVPHNRDWDEIADLTGDESWRAESMRQYFQRMEDCHHRLWPPWRWIHRLFGWNPSRHGFDGWLSTEKAFPRRALWDTTLVRCLLRSAKYALKANGQPVNRLTWAFEGKGDPNDWRLVSKDAVGIRYPPLTTRGHARMGTRERLLEAQRKHPDTLTIELDALVTRVLFDDDNRAIGVEYQKGKRLYEAHWRASASDGVCHTVHARREVILAGGAFNTPQLLMLSGIGDRATLEGFGITVRADLPGVGKNLQDRYEITQVNRMKRGWRALDGVELRKGDAVYRQWQARRGAYTTNGAALAIVSRSAPERPLPDLFCFAVLGRFVGYQPGYSRDSIRRDYLTWTVLKAHTNNTAGTVELDPVDPTNPRKRPKINFRYFEEGTDAAGEDLDSVVSGLEFVRRAAERIAPMIADEEYPGRAIADREGLRQFVRDTAWGHHASCTCAIGSDDDPNAVLDSAFRVRGVTGLRVVDASVFPKIPGFFILCAVYMIAEKAADVILEERG